MDKEGQASESQTRSHASYLDWRVGKVPERQPRKNEPITQRAVQTFSKGFGRLGSIKVIDTTIYSTESPQVKKERLLQAIQDTPFSCPVKQFIYELDRLIPHNAKGKRKKVINHGAAFRTYRSIKDFGELWATPDESPENQACILEILAIQLLSNHDSIEGATALLRAWYTKHHIAPDEVAIQNAVHEADVRTLAKRTFFHEMKTMESAQKPKEPKTKKKLRTA
jgi:hypothetical protein